MDHRNELIKLMFWANYIWTGRDSILHFKKAVVTSEVYISVAAVSLRKKN